MAKASDNPTPKKRRQGQHPSPDEKQQTQTLFLESFATMGNVRLACKHAGIHRSTFYAWLEQDEHFSFEYHQAEADANDALRAEIFRRAVQGVNEPLASMGRLVKDEQGNVVTVKKYSDTLLIFLAKARMPEFREKQSEEVQHQLKVVFMVPDVAELPTIATAVVDSDTWPEAPEDE